MKTGTANHAVSIAAGAPTIQPNRPPDCESATIPSLGCGRLPRTWESPEALSIARPRPMAMRRLSCTPDGLLKSQKANATIRIGSPKATRPKSPPKVHALICTATGFPIRNHSVIAPTTASSTSRSGMPSRRSSLAIGSGRNARAAPPTACARPIQARPNPPPCGSGSRTLVAEVREPERERPVLCVFEREDVLPAMRTRYLRPPTFAGIPLGAWDFTLGRYPQDRHGHGPPGVRSGPYRRRSRARSARASGARTASSTAK
ncbi:hypothetical protein ACFQV7_03225 [Leucobacter soli]|uniref:hypothetical protein n=1 Tax=Leucobacter soli TaxID=2812850 RepID=UPI00361E903B